MSARSGVLGVKVMLLMLTKSMFLMGDLIFDLGEHGRLLGLIGVCVAEILERRAGFRAVLNGIIFAEKFGVHKISINE